HLASRRGMRLEPRLSPVWEATLVAHRSGDVADVQEPDLTEVDARERMADERVQPRLVDLDVEDAAAAGGDERRLNVALIAGHVCVHPRSVEQRPDHVEFGVEARAGVDDPEANGVTGIRAERMRHVLAGVPVPGHPVRFLTL